MAQMAQYPIPFSYKHEPSLSQRQIGRLRTPTYFRFVEDLLCNHAPIPFVRVYHDSL